jgi:hypothetical protein
MENRISHTVQVCYIEMQISPTVQIWYMKNKISHTVQFWNGKPDISYCSNLIWKARHLLLYKFDMENKISPSGQI